MVAKQSRTSALTLIVKNGSKNAILPWVINATKVVRQTVIKIVRVMIQ